MTEREKAANYLRYIASLWPSAGFIDRNNPSPETVKMGRAIIRTCADQIEKGEHVRWFEEEASKWL